MMDDLDRYWPQPFSQKTNAQKLAEFKERRSAKAEQVAITHASQRPFETAKEPIERSAVGQAELNKMKAFFNRPKSSR